MVNDVHKKFQLDPSGDGDNNNNNNNKYTTNTTTTTTTTITTTTTTTTTTTITTTTTTITTHYEMRRLFDPRWGRIFGQCVRYMPTQQHEEYGLLLSCSDDFYIES